MGADYGNRILLVYEWVGRGKEEISTYERINLKSSLKTAARRMGIPLRKINEVTYMYNPLNLNSSAAANNIPSGGVLTIKLKSDF